MSHTFNFNAANQQNQIGDNNTQTMNISSDSIGLEEFLTGLENTFKPDGDKSMPETIGSTFGSPLAIGVLSDIRTTALEAESGGEFDPERAQTILERFTTILAESTPKIRKGLVAFSTTAASAYFGDNPIVRGVLAAIQAIQEP
jgi:hypothetical protein